MSRFLAVITALAVVAVLAPARARADEAADAKVIKKIEDANRIALEDYDLGDAAAAQKGLLAALELAKGAALDRHAVTLKTRLHLGVVLAAGLLQPEKARLEFMGVLEIDAAAAVPEALRTPGIDKLFEEAKADLSRRRADAAERAVALVHEPVDSAREGETIPLSAIAGKTLKAARLVLHYRPAGAAAFVRVGMTQDADGVYRGAIPAEATAVDGIDYFIQAENAKNKVVAGKGNPNAPFRIAIQRQQKPVAPEDDDDENPLENKKGK